MSGSVYPYPLNQKQRILDDIHAEFEDYRAEYPDAAMDDFLKREGDIFNFYWYDLIRNPMLPVLQTTTGEPMIISKALYEIKNKEAVINGLTKPARITKTDAAETAITGTGLILKNTNAVPVMALPMPANITPMVFFRIRNPAPAQNNSAPTALTRFRTEKPAFDT